MMSVVRMCCGFGECDECVVSIYSGFGECDECDTYA